MPFLSEFSKFLKEGASKRLTDLVAAFGEGRTNALTVSLALDVHNDLGHGVPVLSSTDHTVAHREWRGGEPGEYPVNPVTGGTYSALPYCDFPADPANPSGDPRPS
jgi:hypothetical protein